MKNKYIILIFIIFNSIYGFATYQITDKVIYEGRTYKSHCQSVFNELLENEGLSIDDIIEKETKTKWNSGCLKKYYLTLLIKDNKVYISSVKDLDERKINLKEYFPDKVIKNKIFAKWYSGIIILNEGETIRNDFWLEYSKEIRLYIKNGVVTGKFNIEYLGDDFNINTKYVYNETFIFLNKYNLNKTNTNNIQNFNGKEIEWGCYDNSIDSIKLCFFTYPMNNLKKEEILNKELINHKIIDNPKYKIYNQKTTLKNKIIEKNIIFNQNKYTVFYLEYIEDELNNKLKSDFYKSIKLIQKLN